MADRIDTPKNLPHAGPETLPDDCPAWIKRDQPKVQALLNTHFHHQRQPLPAATVTCREVCCDMLLAHHRGQIALDLTDLALCLRFVGEAWPIPTTISLRDLWQYSEDRCGHGLSMSEFQRSYFWREFRRSGAMLNMALHQRQHKARQIQAED